MDYSINKVLSLYIFNPIEELFLKIEIQLSTQRYIGIDILYLYSIKWNCSLDFLSVWGDLNTVNVLYFLGKQEIPYLKKLCSKRKQCKK